MVMIHLLVLMNTAVNLNTAASPSPEGGHVATVVPQAIFIDAAC